MAKCKYCGARTDKENAVCDHCRKLFEYIRTDHLENGTAGFSDEAYDGWRLSAVLCYIPFLFWIPYLMSHRSPYVRFHANQGLILSVFTVLCAAVGVIGSFLREGIVGTFAGYLIMIGIAVLWAGYVIWGLVSAISGSGNVLPLIGKIRILK